MQQTIIEIELNKIEPSPTNPRKYFNQEKLIELSESIKQTNGVIQAITVRIHPKHKNKFEIVFGERRYRASALAERITISAVVKEFTDEQVQELQFIENIEREDVHPMDEAVTFKAMLENAKKAWTIEDIAAKITKPASYVAQRLQLNNLLPQLQKQFWDEKFLIGHAILFARLQETDQKEVIKHWNVYDGSEYKSVKKVEEYINSSVMMKLSAAPFKKDDAALLPAAGACLGCIKRTGGNILFPEMKKDDRCTDRKCFELKTEAYMLQQLEEVLTNTPDVFIIKNTHNAEPPKAAEKLCTKYKVHIINYGNSAGITEAKYDGYTAIKVFWLNGPSAGKITTAYKQMSGKAKIEAKAAAGEKITAADIDEQIAQIKQRIVRTKELSYEAAQQEILKQLKEKQDPNTLLKVPFGPQLAILMRNFLLYKKSLHIGGLTDLFFLGEDKTNPELFFEKLGHLSVTDIDSLVYGLVWHNFSGTFSEGAESYLMRQVATALGVDAASIESEHLHNSTHKIMKAEIKIDELEEQKAALQHKKKIAPAAKKVAPVAKKKASGIKKLIEA